MNPQRTEAVCRVMARDNASSLPHHCHHRCEVDARCHAHPHSSAGTCVPYCPRRPKESFRRNAAGIEAIAAQPRAFENGNASAETGSADGGDKTGRASADDHQVVERGRGRVAPALGTYVRKQARVVLVQGMDKYLVVHPSIFSPPKRLAKLWSRKGGKREQMND